MHSNVYKAAQLGDFDFLITIISKNGEDIFQQATPNGSNILHIAAQCKQVNLIENLIQCPLGPSLLWQCNNKGDTPLHVAAKVGSCKVVRLFTDLAKSLHWVAENGQIDACKELLQKHNLHKNTAFHLAVRGGHDLVVELLIEEDPQLCDIINAANESPLYLAADRGLSRTTELILGAFSWSSSHKGPKGLTALHAGISLPLTVWEKIMEKRPEAMREGDDMGWTPLHYVAYLGKIKAVRVLLRHNSSVTYDLDKAGESALHLAAFQGHTKVIDELVRSCPDACDIINTKGQTALHTAALGEQVNVVKYILRMRNQEDLINEQDTDGNTALHLAALHKKYKIIFILARDKRVDNLAKNKDHLTALDIFDTHKEIGYKAAKVGYLLKGSFGIPGFQGWFVEHGKKRLDNLIAQAQLSASTTTGSDISNRDNFDLSKRGIMDIQLLVAGLIATVTFAVAFTVPGGYDNTGTAIHAGRADFGTFVISNSFAFLFSFLAIHLHYESLTVSYGQERKYIPAVGGCIEIAMFGLLIAYCTGLRLASKIPPGSIEEGVHACIVWGFYFAFFFLVTREPHLYPLSLPLAGPGLRTASQQPRSPTAPCLHFPFFAALLEKQRRYYFCLIVARTNHHRLTFSHPEPLDPSQQLAELPISPTSH
ncbi:hypothetical protein BT93_D1256 [Corymbia citriodora subsp. variegata]|nr:hypothetical protein BT93_D1256 [Corymbia citriodora subsp. variegata]